MEIYKNRSTHHLKSNNQKINTLLNFKFNKILTRKNKNIHHLKINRLQIINNSKFKKKMNKIIHHLKNNKIQTTITFKHLCHNIIQKKKDNNFCNIHNNTNYKNKNN